MGSMTKLTVAFAILRTRLEMTKQITQRIRAPSREAYNHRTDPKIYGVYFIVPEKLLPCPQNVS
jgi:hypothetical protein